MLSSDKVTRVDHEISREQTDDRRTLHCGILLKEVGYREGLTALLKVGSFSTAGPPFSYLEESDVDWYVL